MAIAYEGMENFGKVLECSRYFIIILKFDICLKTKKLKTKFLDFREYAAKCEVHQGN